MNRDRMLVWGLSNNKAGTEKVIYNYCKALPDRAIDFLCYDNPESYSDLLDNGMNRFFTIPIKIQHPLQYERALRNFVNSHMREYNALWFNINDISNIDLLLYAKRCGVPRRIAHMHNAGMPSNPITVAFSRLHEKAFSGALTERWACSESAGRFLYGDSSFTVVPNFVDSAKVVFSEEKRKLIRQKYCLEDKWVVGAVGRLEKQKNYGFLVDAFNRLRDVCSNSVLVIVGEGSMRKELEERILACNLKIGHDVIMPGSCSDIQAWYSAFDVAAYPSLYEGLSLSILEAQFNGLPLVLSDGISDECKISEQVSFEPLDDEIWAKRFVGVSRQTQHLTEKANQFAISNAPAIAKSLFS